MTNISTKNVLLGQISVDSGRILVADPCNAGTLAKQLNAGNNPQQNYAVVLDNFGGDGLFCVYGDYDSLGHLESVTIDFRHGQGR